MTAYTQSGYPVVTGLANIDRGFIVEGVAFPGGVLAGDVATIFRYIASRWHREIEPLRAGWCWGGYVKTITGGSGWSNHAGYAAIDINAPAHPQYKRTLTAAQYATARRIRDACDGVVRWGGDFTAGSLDEMHWEIAPGKAGGPVKALAAKIRTQEDDMPYTEAQLDKIIRASVRQVIDNQISRIVKPIVAAEVDRAIHATNVKGDWIAKRVIHGGDPNKPLPDTIAATNRALARIETEVTK